jgi:hypothetical protein
MLKSLWRDGAFPRRGQGFRPGFNSALETAATVTALIGIAISPMRADDIDARMHQVDTKEGADIGSKGERELVVGSTLRAGRGTDAFADIASQFEFEYPAFQSLRISAAATIGYYDIDGVAGIEDARRAAIQPLSVDARFRMLDTDHFGAEIQTLAIEPKFDLPRKEIRKCTR